MELVPLKIKIGLKQAGGWEYPVFNSIDAGLRDGMDWTRFIDKFGGWMYDQQSDHKNHDPDAGSPMGTKLGMFLVPQAFADAAVAMFPNVVSIVTEAEVETFYEERCTKHQLEIREDNAMNPDHPEPGRLRNKLKTWAEWKLARLQTR